MATPLAKLSGSTGYQAEQTWFNACTTGTRLCITGIERLRGGSTALALWHGGNTTRRAGYMKLNTMKAYGWKISLRGCFIRKG